MNICKLIFICFVATLISFSNLQAKQVTINNNGDWVAQLKQLKPGDTATFTKGRFSSGSYSHNAKSITINGSNNKPIIIKGSGSQDTVLDGEGSVAALIFEDCSNIIIENFTITNPSRSADGRTRRISVKAGSLSQGFMIQGGNNITVRKSLFNNIGTRGILTQKSKGHLTNFTLEKNLFFNIGNDTASGDINMNSGQNWVIRHNLFAGNVDGIVNAGLTLGGGLIEENIFMNHWQEDNIDIKGHIASKNTIIKKNIIYTNRAKTGVTIQNSSRNITISDNVFYHGAQPGQIWIHGRSHNKGDITDPVENISVSNNVLYGNNSKKDRGIIIQPSKYKKFSGGKEHKPVPMRNINISNNYITNQQNTIINRIGNNAKLSNNKFTPPPNNLQQNFKSLESSILKIIENIFPQSIIQEAFNEAKIPFSSGSRNDAELAPPNNLSIK